MIDLKYIKYIFLMFLLKRIIATFLLILIIAGVVVLAFKVSKFSYIVSEFLVMQYNFLFFSLYLLLTFLFSWSICIFSYLFFYFVRKLIMKILYNK
jgi:hypothetical protein